MIINSGVTLCVKWLVSGRPRLSAFSRRSRDRHYPYKVEFVVKKEHAIWVSMDYAPKTSFDSRLDPDAALQRLIEGNTRFMYGKPMFIKDGLERRRKVAGGQTPFAAIFGDIDSRVPPEMIFDQGLGNLLVIRNAAHVIDDISLGTIEFCIKNMGVPLVVVLGNQRCGAVATTLDVMDNHMQVDGSIDYLVKAIMPAVVEARMAHGDLLDQSIRKHIRLTVKKLRQSPVIAEAVTSGHVRVVGAYYNLDTGGVEMTDQE